MIELYTDNGVPLSFCFKSEIMSDIATFPDGPTDVEIQKFTSCNMYM